MARLLLVAALVALLALGAYLVLGKGSASSEDAVVAQVLDGDTIVLTNGRHVRLVQIDTPEKGTECFGDNASALTRHLIPPGTHVRIEQDPRLDQVDRYNRELAYVLRDDENVNVTLVRQGAAGVWFFHGREGRYADELLRAVEQARAARRGLWGACPLARFDPGAAMSSGPA